MTNHKLIQGAKIPALAVVLPDEANTFQINNDRLFFYHPAEGQQYLLSVPLPPSPVWNQVFKASEATEEQAAMLVERFCHKMGWSADEVKYPLTKVCLFMNYKYNPPVPASFLCSTAKKSLLSLLESNGYVVSNPYGESEPVRCGCQGPCGLPCKYADWQEAQSKIQNVYVII